MSQNDIFRQAVCTNAHNDIDSFGALGHVPPRLPTEVTLTANYPTIV